MAIGETISHWMWDGPGAGTWHGAAVAMSQLVTQLTGIQDGQLANSGVLSVAWASPTGERAVAANTPYQAWLTQLGPQIDTMANQIATTGTAFHTAQFATPNPGVFANDWSNVISTAHGLPLSFPAFFAALNKYMMDTVQAMQAYFGTWMPPSMSLAAATLLQPLSPPPASAVPNAGLLAPSMSGASAAAAGLPSSAATALPSALGALPSAGSAAAPAAGALSQLLSQPGSALASSGGELGSLAQAPSAMTSGLGAVPSMASAPMSALGSTGAGSGGAGASPASWFPGMSGEGGTVTAALSGGGAGVGGLGGFGGTGAMSALRGPVSWASSANPANPTAGGDQVLVSRFTEARAASATSSGMGAPGTMMPPARNASAKDGQESDARLASVAAPYRVPRNMPVITGANGAQIVAGEEEDRYQIL